LTYAFEVVELPHVLAFARAENVASRRVLEKVGMTLVGPHTYRSFPAVLYRIESPFELTRPQGGR
jgi:RimJ/RimL family protein N-acetyltransferase